MVFNPVLSVANRSDLTTLFKLGGVGAELGVLYGDYSLRLHIGAKPSKLFLVDRWTTSSPEAWKPGNQSWQEILDAAKANMHGRPGVEFVLSDTLAWLKSQPDDSLDWVYLDGDHTRRAVAAEIAEARRVVKPQGIIAGHDYTLDPRDQHGNPYPCGVVEAVQDAIAQGVGSLMAVTREPVPSFAIRTAAKPGTKLVIGCSPRTGSNLLIDSLAQHPRALNGGEVFNIPLFWTPRVRGLKQRGLKQRGLCPIEHCNLFKLFPYDRGHYGFEQLLAESKVIYLYRADRAAQLASWRKACETGIWYQGQVVPHKVPFPENANETIDLAETLFAQRAGVTLSYEKLVQDWSRSIAAILELAGWENVPLGMALEKQR